MLRGTKALGGNWGKMELAITIGALVTGLGLAGGMVWLERRPRKDFEVRLLPTTPIMFAGVLIAILAVVHLMTLGGVSLPRR